VCYYFLEMKTPPLFTAEKPKTLICSGCGMNGNINTDSNEKNTYCFNCKKITLFKMPEEIPINTECLFEGFVGFC